MVPLHLIRTSPSLGKRDKKKKVLRKRKSCRKPQETYRPRRNLSVGGGGGWYPSPGQGGAPVLAGGIPQSWLGACPGVSPPGRICNRTGVPPTPGRIWDQRLRRDLGPEAGVPSPLTSERTWAGVEAGKEPDTRGWGTAPPPPPC